VEYRWVLVQSKGPRHSIKDDSKKYGSGTLKEFKKAKNALIGGTKGGRWSGMSQSETFFFFNKVGG